jgi:hypothetical protein
MLDRRCLEKISESLSAPTLGLVWQDLPLMAGVMVEEVRRSLLEKSPHSMKNLMVLAWCKYNSYTPYFSCPLTARVVRRCMKQTGGVDFHMEQTGLEAAIAESVDVRPEVPERLLQCALWTSAAPSEAVDGSSLPCGDERCELDALLMAAMTEDAETSPVEEGETESEMDSDFETDVESDLGETAPPPGRKRKRDLP